MSEGHLDLGTSCRMCIPLISFYCFLLFSHFSQQVGKVLAPTFWLLFFKNLFYSSFPILTWTFPKEKKGRRVFEINTEGAALGPKCTRTLGRCPFSLVEEFEWTHHSIYDRIKNQRIACEQTEKIGTNRPVFFGRIWRVHRADNKRLKRNPILFSFFHPNPLDYWFETSVLCYFLGAVLVRLPIVLSSARHLRRPLVIVAIPLTFHFSCLLFFPFFFSNQRSKLFHFAQLPVRGKDDI